MMEPMSTTKTNLDDRTLRGKQGHTDTSHMRFLPYRERFARWMPFAAVAVVGQLSAAWPPGPSNKTDFWVSTALLVALTFLIVLRRQVIPRTWLIRVCIYITSVVFLMIATGGVSSGLGSLLLMPVVGVALYGRRWESVVLVALITVALLVVSLATPEVAAATARRLILFGSITVMFSVSIHTLREHLTNSNARTRRLLGQEEAMNDAARQLALMLDPVAITGLGAQLAARITSQTGSELCRASYLRIEEGVVRGAQSDDSGRVVAQSWPICELPPLEEAVQTRQPISAHLLPHDVGSTIKTMLADTGVTHAAWVPVCPDGELHGALTIATQGVPVPAECVERCVALGNLLQIALANCAAHQKLEQQATAEERRRIARELHDGLAHELAFIASKTRGSDNCQGSLDVRQLADAADRALDEARRAITVLSAAPPQSLSCAVAQTAEDLGERLELAVHLDLAEDIEIPGEVTENLLRILREAMTNAAQHGASRQVRVRLERADGLRLVVQDDGCGFDPLDTSLSKGFGLMSMRERAESIGGLLSLDSDPARGTRIEITVP
jgi:signal transduction histidine kinase